MREGVQRPVGKLRIIDDLRGQALAAVVYSDPSASISLLRLNRPLISGDGFDRVLLWARHAIAEGKEMAWLLADELDALP